MIMSEDEKSKIGTVSWRDLTVPDAEAVRDFYAQVVGWKAKPLSMGDYDDYCMIAEGADETVAGICHARGVNANLPPQWLIYITVADVEASAKRCVEHGGRIVDGPHQVAEPIEADVVW